MTQLDSLTNSRLELLLQTTSDISHHTDAWDSILSGAITVITVLAAMATLVGLTVIWSELNQRRYTKKRQGLFIKDLIRHLFANAAIMETLQLKSNSQWDKVHPADGVFSRFAVLESDLSLGDIRVKDNQFLKLHSLKIFLRNYNITASIAESTFSCQSIPSKDKNALIDELWKRTKRLVEELLDLGIAAKLLSGSIDQPEEAQKEVAVFIKDYYSKDNADITPLPIFDRDGSRALFDNLGFGLKDEMDKTITRRMNDIRIIEF